MTGQVAPGWFPDPWRPGRWLWWTGQEWFDPTVPPPPPRVSTRAAAGAALAEIRSRPVPYGAVGAVMLASIGAIYVAATFGVGLLFGFDWFTDVPPPGVATTVTAIAQVLLVVVVTVTGTWTFGAFAALGLGEHSIRGAYAGSGRQLIRDALFALPGFIVAVLAVMSVVLGPLVVGLLATLAVSRIAGPTSGSTSSRFGRGIVLGLIPTAVSLIVWAVGAAAAPFPSPPTWLAVVFFIGLVGTSTFSMAWLAVANAVLVRGLPISADGAVEARR